MKIRSECDGTWPSDPLSICLDVVVVISAANLIAIFFNFMNSTTSSWSSAEHIINSFMRKWFPGEGDILQICGSLLSQVFHRLYHTDEDWFVCLDLNELLVWPSCFTSRLSPTVCVFAEFSLPCGYNQNKEWFFFQIQTALWVVYAWSSVTNRMVTYWP